MAEAQKDIKKPDPIDLGLSSDDVRGHYEEFANLLKKRREELVPQQDAARANLNEQIAEAPGDEADTSVLDTSADYFLKLANNQQQELLEIRDAFDRMDRGVYGICQNCGEPIALERLRRLPYARFDIDCQSALEKGRLTIVPRPYPKL
jgi:DnaK suppressor protein